MGALEGGDGPAQCGPLTFAKNLLHQAPCWGCYRHWLIQSLYKALRYFYDYSHFINQGPEASRASASYKAEDGAGIGAQVCLTHVPVPLPRVSDFRESSGSLELLVYKVASQPSAPEILIQVWAGAWESALEIRSLVALSRGQKTPF